MAITRRRDQENRYFENLLDKVLSRHGMKKTRMELGEPQVEWDSQDICIIYYPEFGVQNRKTAERVVITPKIAGVKIGNKVYCFYDDKTSKVLDEEGGFEYSRYFPGYGGILVNLNGSRIGKNLFASELEKMIGSIH